MALGDLATTSPPATGGADDLNQVWQGASAMGRRVAQRLGLAGEPASDDLGERISPHPRPQRGEASTAVLAARPGGQAKAARELSDRLYIISERRKRVQEAKAYNGLVCSWPEIARLAQATRRTAQALLF